MESRRWLFVVASAASAGAAAAAFAASAPARAQDGPRAGEAPACAEGTTVQTDKGPVCGTAGNGVRSWLGVPYAAPPRGEPAVGADGAARGLDVHP
ncbi:hypothetical protein [Actinomadura sp. NPDC049753]|uniref:hypothetical protein n=1 Tax=Actinomadura sp. NPDC049753 TaxID=3154739 RepID=UPI00341E9B07